VKIKIVQGREIMAPWIEVTISPGRRARLHCGRCEDVALVSRSDPASFTSERDWRRIHRKCVEGGKQGARAQSIQG
jgi:hypothetical protein